MFRDAAVVSLVKAQIMRTAEEQRFTVLEYCFMPDHLHLLVKGLTADSNLQQFAKMSKQRSGALYKRRYHARLWQSSYHDRVLRDPAQVRRVAKYIFENPVGQVLLCGPARDRQV